MEKPEKIEAQEDTPEVFENGIELWLDDFCRNRKPPITDMGKESQSVWNAALMYIGKHLFKNTGRLKSKKIDTDNLNICFPSNYNAYDYDKVNEVCDIYIYLCMVYEKECSYIGFSLLTGINYDTLIDWRNNERKLSSKSFDIAEKLRTFREESLSAKLATANKNPVGILAILNRHFQWNLPGVSREKATAAPLTAAELPQLTVSNCAELPHNLDNLKPETGENSAHNSDNSNPAI